MSGVVAFEGELNAIVKEYLEFNNFDRTMNEFECECTSRGNPIASYDGQTKKTDHKAHTMQEEMMECFTLGLRDDFFSQWVENIPEKIRNEDSVAQKLEFYVHIYFAIYPMKYNTKDIDERMSYFKTYLETRGASLSQTTEFLPFYALPFVPNPKTHPSYKELFNDRWVPDLQIRLEKFLVLVLQSSTQPRLFELYKGSVGSPSDLKNLQKMAHDSDRKTNTYIKRYNRIQGDYHNLIGITADLVDTLEATVQGRPVSPGYLQKVCQRLFSNQVRQSVDITRPGTAGEVLRQSVLPPQGIQHKENMHGSSLDYDKIKRDLQDGNERTKGLLLQALRWKLTKTPPPERDAMLAAYIQYDILGCASDSSYRKAAENLLTSGSVIVEQYTARVYNAFASLTEGRQYLSQNGNLVKSLLLNLRNGKGDAVCQENILGCLQKLSLRRQQQSVMIEDGVIEWLVSILADDDELSDYMLEYSVALLMNLCLRTAGKRRCADSAYKVLKVLSDLLGHNNQEIIPYVNGALYSILAIPSIREEAISMDMEDILKCFIKDGQADMNRQIEFIIKQLNSDEAPEDFESDDEEEEEEEEEQDAMEADLDKAELIKSQSNELHGNRLLHTHYAGSVSPNQKKRKATDNVSGVDDLLTRPVTPLQRKGGETPVVHVQPRSGRPPTGQSRSSSRGSSRGSSRSEVHRPPTRSGSCASSLSDTPREPPAITTDREGSEIVSKAVGSNKKLAVAMDEQNKPSKRAMEKVSSKQVDVAEYGAAFGSRPRIARTPDVSSHHQSGSGRSSRTSHSSGGSRPTSRGSFSEGPTPQPKYSDSLPTSRPNSGGRPNSSGNTKPPSPAMKQRSNREHSETESRKGSHRVKRH